MLDVVPGAGVLVLREVHSGAGCSSSAPLSDRQKAHLSDWGPRNGAASSLIDFAKSPICLTFS